MAISALALLLPIPASAATIEAQKVSPKRYEIDVSFEPEKGFLHAKAAVTLELRQPVEAIEFELNSRLNILGITDSPGRKLEFARSRRLGSPKLSVRLAMPSAAGQAITLTFTYEGVLPPNPLDYITKDGILLRDESRWYPAVDLSAFTQNSISFDLPSGWQAITSGRRVGSPAGYAWETTQPVSSRSIVALPKHSLVCSPPLTRETHYIAHWTACYIGPDAEIGKPVAAGARELLQHYGEAFGGLTPGGLVVVQGFPGQRGAIGYSAPGFLVVSEDVVKFFDYPGYAPEFLPHEVAHQWSPVELTLKSEADGWLAESLAEYLAWRYLAEKDAAQAGNMVMRAMRDSLAPEPLRPLSLGLRLFALEGSAVTHATLYQRGMLVWRTLETVIDRERVDRALREFYRRYAGTAASIADFRKVSEEIAGRDLGWFFDYFIGGTRVPEIELRRTPAAAPGEVSGEIVVRNVPPEFSVRVEMRLETTGGTVEHSVATRGEVTPFTVTVARPVTRITLDPDARLLRWTEAARRNRSQHALMAQLGERERAGEFERAVALCQQAFELDPEDLASNHQQIFFLMGRLRYRMGQLAGARANFARVLALRSLETMDSDFYRAWARVYGARIERRLGHSLSARAEARAGLESNSPALETRVRWPDTPQRESSARDALRVLAR